MSPAFHRRMLGWPTLTRVQWRELSDLACRDGPASYDQRYQPIVRLHALGLVERRSQRWGRNTYVITDVGRAMLAGRNGVDDGRRAEP